MLFAAIISETTISPGPRIGHWKNWDRNLVSEPLLSSLVMEPCMGGGGGSAFTYVVRAGKVDKQRKHHMLSRCSEKLPNKVL